MQWESDERFFVSGNGRYNFFLWRVRDGNITNISLINWSLVHHLFATWVTQSTSINSSDSGNQAQSTIVPDSWLSVLIQKVHVYSTMAWFLTLEYLPRLKISPWCNKTTSVTFPQHVILALVFPAAVSDSSINRIEFRERHLLWIFWSTGLTHKVWNIGHLLNNQY